MLLNDDIEFVEPGDGMVRSIPFVVNIWFNKVITKYSVVVKVDDGVVDPDLITLTETTQPTHWKHHKGTRGLQNITTTYHVLSFDHYFNSKSMGIFTLTYDTATEENKTFSFTIYQQIGDYYN